jgi:hypothetical protein
VVRESIKRYVETQKANLNRIASVAEFQLVDLVEGLYDCAISSLPTDIPPRYGRFLLLCHQGFLAAATLISQAQPYDAAPITRRCIEIACVCLASKYDQKAEEKWLAYEKRDARWKARQAGSKPPRLPPIQYDIPVTHPLMKELNEQLGTLSDGSVHFTPEYYVSQNWKDQSEAEPPRINLSYFISDMQVIGNELIILAGTHTKILQIIDECIDQKLSDQKAWKTILEKLSQKHSVIMKQRPRIRARSGAGVGPS